MEMGFRIVDERLARAAGRWYVGIAAEEGEAEYSPEELLAGPVLLKEKPEGLAAYAEDRIHVLQKAFEGAVRGSKHEMTEQLAWELAQWKEIRACLQP